MPELSENQLVVLTGKPPRTVRKRLDKLEFKRGKGRAKLYDSSVALALILGAGDGEPLVMSRHRQHRQDLEQLPELPAVLRELFAELDRETCSCFQAVTEILREHYVREIEAPPAHD